MDKRQEAVLKERLAKTYTKGGSTQRNTSHTVLQGNAIHNSETHAEGEGEADIDLNSRADISGRGSMKGKIGVSGASASTGTSEYDGTESPLVFNTEGKSSSSGNTSAENEFEATVAGNTKGKVKNRTQMDAKTLGTTISIQNGITTGESHSSNWSESESIQLYVDYLNYLAEVDVQFYSEQEQIAMGSQVINGFANRHCVVQLPGGVILLSKTPDMSDPQITDEEREQKMLPFYSSLKKLEDIEQEIAVRQAPFQAKARGGKKGKEI
jgi:hypothetical protein